MSRDEILDMFDDICDEWVTAAIRSRTAAPRAGLRSRRVLLLAATIALGLLLVGCGVVYALKMQDLKLGEGQVSRDKWDREQHALVEVTMPQQVLTLSGLKGSPGYQAAREWYEFQQEYDPEHIILNSIRGNVPEFPEEYAFYNPYSQEMVDKIDEICEKYGLKRMGAPLASQTSEAMLEYLGIQGVLLPGAPAQALGPSAVYYEGGYFRSEFDILMDEGEGVWPYRSMVGFQYTPKDCFNSRLYQLEGDDWQERNYTTASGQEVLILRSPTTWESWGFCDVGDGTVTLRMETIDQVFTDQNGYPEVLETHMTDDQMNQILDTINFDLTITPGDPAILEGQKASTERVQTQGGYTVEVKEVVTDGCRTAITLGLTGPEGVNLEQYVGDQSFYTGSLNFSGQSFEPVKQIDWRSGGGALNPRLDGDGKANTVEFFGLVMLEAEEGVAFPEGSRCNLFLKDLYVDAWNQELAQFDTLWSQEGIWNFDITLDQGDWRELEFISAPVTTRAGVGWGENGEDICEDVTITSLTLRAFGGKLTTQSGWGYAALCDYPGGKFHTLVLEDGETICLDDDLEPQDPEYWGKQIPLEKIAYFQLPDGTQLYPNRMK